MNNVKEYVTIILAFIGLIFVLALMNIFTNSLKESDCDKRGGQLIRNIDSQYTTCIIKDTQ